MLPISVFVADSDYLTREGLKYIFSKENEVKIVGEATYTKELLDKLQKIPCEVIVLDYNQPGSFDMNTVKAVKTVAPSASLLIISSDNNKQNIYQIISGGVNNFLTKRCSREEILSAVKAAAKGEKFFCKNVLNYILEKSFRPQETKATVPLTTRELEIVRLIAKGFISKEIATQLNITTHTVYTHRKKILKKLGLSSASELILYAVNQGIVD
ncbi:MAG: response regulator transcription factor [Bacteroidota bacterium]